MELEQLEANVAEFANRHRTPFDSVHMPRELFDELIVYAWNAGKNYGFHTGSQEALQTFDVLKKVRIAE